MKFLLKESYYISLQSKAGFLSVTLEIKLSDVSKPCISSIVSEICLVVIAFTYIDIIF